MSRTTIRIPAVLLGFLACGCSGNDGAPSPGDANGGAMASSTATLGGGSGGNSNSSTVVATGGKTNGQGGNSSTGTLASTGGAPGAATGVGGASKGSTVASDVGGASPSSGGASLTGGSVATGGNASLGAGGTAVGGGGNGGTATGNGGTATGNGGTATGSGGTATGGTSAVGIGGRGGNATGGTTSSSLTGGASATGGSATGGNLATGGNTSVGGSSGNDGPAYMPAFIIGADISRVQEQEDRGTKFKDVDGTTPSGTTSTGGGLLTILKNHGFNYIRLRIFVNPAASGGYSSAGYCDLAHTAKFAAGVKLAGMGLLLDFHYSDTWADPGHQAKPAAWANLSTAALTTKIYDYTKDVVSQLKAANGRPDMVQIGNEIPSGMLWEDGRASGSNFTNLGAFLKAGVTATKAVDSNIKIMLHLDRCHELSTNTWWLEGVWSQGVEFDILGESCYDRANYQRPTSAWPGMFSGLIQNGTGSNRYATNYAKLQFVAAEYSDSKQLVNDTIFNIANRRGLGTFIWEPTNWGEQMFDGSGRALSQYFTIFDNIAATYGKR